MKDNLICAGLAVATTAAFIALLVGLCLWLGPVGIIAYIILLALPVALFPA